MNNKTSDAQKAWVVFTGQTDLKRLFFLKAGFKHCFVVVHDGSRWVTLDPLASHIELKVQELADEFDLIHWLKSQGHEALPARVIANTKPAPAAFISCVEIAKRLIGLQNRFIITPWQLYCRLQRDAILVHPHPIDNKE
ncbi:MAG: hypothetical protein KDI13_00215 [Alphaproteobacteria bacterium]|nr:hypothetical protein [Alphaproteobacteria bacterium]